MLDKTGTVTYGAPMVSKICMFAFDGMMSLEKMLAVMGTAESNSEHPIASGKIRNFNSFYLVSKTV